MFVTMSGWGGGCVSFVSFVTLARCLDRRSPCRGEGRVTVLERISRLAAHPRGAGGEGDRPARGEGDNEGDSLGGRPFARAARAARAGEEVHADCRVGWGDRRHQAST